ncbi:MAG TPA: protein kinase [Kofleriaceae bacterium]|jgi:serine/threonine-protein kinase|nr:protein kinase [Kofleriaceae bacterium]
MVKVGDVVLERYRVVEQIGSGGHSVVFRGQDERLSRPVCIKVFSGIAGSSGVGRTSYEHFVQEAFALSRLTHPNTLRIFDFGHLGSNEEPVQVCEYMNGGTLAQAVRERGPQPLAETVRVIGAMCAALAEAHALGIVHRDIKPQNILFGTSGGDALPKLADFGIAKWSADAEDSGQRAGDTAIVAGQKLAMYSPSWAAPEQLAGQPVSGATDIYSLAVVAIYMLSGKAIFADEDVYAGYKKRRRADELVRTTLDPLGLPPRLIELLTHALAFAPTQRVGSVEELARGLATALEPLHHDPALAPPLASFALTHAAPEAARSAMPSEAPRDMHAPAARIPGPATNHAMPAPVPAPGALPQAGVAARANVPSPHLATNHAMPAPMPPAPFDGRRALMLVDAPQPIGDRSVHVVQLARDQHADLTGPNHLRIRITLIETPSGRIIHCKGLSCFVAPLGGRPSPAVQLDRPGEISLVTPRAQEVGRVRVDGGELAGAVRVFALGPERVGVAADDCEDPLLFDFGPGSDAYFVYTRGRPIVRSPRR